MNRKKYEIFEFIRIIIIFIFLMEFFFFYLLFNIKINKYSIFSGVIIKDNLIQFIVNSDDLKLFIANNNYFMQDKKYSYKIEKINKGVLKRKGIEYHELVIKYKGVSNYKDTDLISISLFDKKICLIKIFEVIWKEDLDEKT